MLRGTLQDGKETLLSWIARQLAGATPPAAVLTAEAPHVASPRLRAPVEESAGALASVEASLAATRAELERSADSSNGSGGGDDAAGSSSGGGSGGGTGSDALRGVVSDLARQLEAAKALLQECREGFASLAAFYGEAGAAQSSEQELWLQLQAFVERFSAAQRALAQEQREEAERLRRQSSSRTPGSAAAASSSSRSGRPRLGPGEGPASGKHQPANGAVHSMPAAAPAQAPPPGSGGTEQAADVPAGPASAARQLSFPSPAKEGLPAAEAEAARLQELVAAAGSSDDEAER
jgi:hypothetical protein